MTVTSISELKNALSEFLNRAAYGRERIIVASRGKPKAAVIGIDDLRRLEELEDALAAHEALEAYEAGETTPWQEAKAELAEGSDDIPPSEDPDQALEAWQQVYEGLSEQEVVEIESIALDRDHFMPQQN